MKFTSSLLFLFGGLTASAAVIEKRTTTRPFHLYAYGTGIGGLPVFYSDGDAFLGNKVPDGSQVNANITFQPSTTTEWIISPTTSNVTLTNATSPALFITPCTTALTNVGFTGYGSTNGTTKGFMSFGNWAMWKDPDAQQIASSFYATPVSDGLWQLKWNSNEIDDGSQSISVAIRKVAPSS